MDAAHLSRLRWRSRRGMRELDQLFTGWLDRHAAAADPAALLAFEELLAVEDDVLWAWAVGRGEPSRPEWQAIYAQFRAAAGA
jgi:antitoxin CptB